MSIEHKHSSKNKEDGDRWIKEIQKYLDLDEEYVTKYAIGYLLQSLRNGEDMERFKWKKK